MKPGIATTEFWVTLAIIAVGAVLASGVLEATPLALKVVGIILAVLKGVQYEWSRTAQKLAALTPPPPGGVATADPPEPRP